MRTPGILAVLIGAWFATDATAEQLVRGITDVTTIDHAGGGSQVVFRWDPDISEGDVAVRRAVLRFELQGDPVAAHRELRVYPITSPWNASSPAVEYDEEFWSRAGLDLRGSGTGVVDLTILVKDIVEQGMVAHGFLLTVGPDDEGGLSQAEISRLAGLSDAQVEVTWRPVPEVPRARG